MSFVDERKDFLLTVRDIIYEHRGIIYGGFNRDMILLKEQKNLSKNERSYPVDIDIIIGYQNHLDMIHTFRTDREYEVNVFYTLSNGYEFTTNGENGKIKKIIEVTKNSYSIKLDTTILINVTGRSEQNFNFMMKTFFNHFPLEFDINKLVSMRENNQYILMHFDDMKNQFIYDKKIDHKKNDHKKIDHNRIECIKRHINRKIAILTTSSIDCVSEKRIEKMLSKNFKIISMNKKIRWIDGQKLSDKDVTCCVCLEEMNIATKRWVPTQNIFNFECSCERLYICEHCCNLNESIPEKCYICRKINYI